jgi:hypothetical protein
MLVAGFKNSTVIAAPARTALKIEVFKIQNREIREFKNEI